MGSSLTPQDAYTEALRAARLRGRTLTAGAIVKLNVALRKAIADLTSIIDGQDGVTNTALRATLMREGLQAALDALTKNVDTITTQGLRLVVSDVVAIHSGLTLSLLKNAELDTDLVSFAQVPTRVLSVLAARPASAATFRTLARRHMLDAADAMDELLTAGAARGVSAAVLGRDIRVMFNGGFPLDLRKTYGLTQAQIAEGKTIAYDAKRIAVSEINNGLREANRQSMIEGGVVLAARWQLSGAHKLEDECDDLAEMDYYGYGAGYYPPEDWPLAPHSFCACVQGGPVKFRPMAEWGTEPTPTPAPKFAVNDLQGRAGYTPARIARQRAVLAKSLNRTPVSGGPAKRG